MSALTREDLSPGLKEALTVFVTRSPLAVSLPMCLEHPDLFLSLSFDQQNMLIEWAFKESLVGDANELCRIKFSSVQKPKKLFEPFLSPSIAELNAQYHPMRNVLSSLNTTANLLGLADEQLFIASDQLSDVVTGAYGPGLSDLDNDLIDQASLVLQKLETQLTEVSEYYRKKAGMA